VHFFDQLVGLENRQVGRAALTGETLHQVTQQRLVEAQFTSKRPDLAVLFGSPLLRQRPVHYSYSKPTPILSSTKTALRICASCSGEHSEKKRSTSSAFLNNRIASNSSSHSPVTPTLSRTFLSLR